MQRQRTVSRLPAIALTLAATWGIMLWAVPAGLQAAPASDWQPLTDAGGRPVMALAAKGQTPLTLYAGTVDTSGEGALLTSPNGGLTWTTALSIPITALSSGPITPTLYAGGLLDGFWRSADGNTWQTQNDGLSATTIASLLATTAPTLYIGSDAGVFISDNDGDSWFPAGPGLPGGTVVQALVDDGGVIMAGTDSMGAFRSLDGGESWFEANDGLNALSVRAFVKSGNTLYAATEAGVFSSVDQGETWTAASAGLTTLDVRALAASRQFPGLLIAGTDAGVFVRTNAGGWQAGRAGGLSGSARSIHAFVIPNTPFEPLIAGTDAGVWKLSALHALLTSYYLPLIQR